LEFCNTGWAGKTRMMAISDDVERLNSLCKALQSFQHNTTIGEIDRQTEMLYQYWHRGSPEVVNIRLTHDKICLTMNY